LVSLLVSEYPGEPNPLPLHPDYVPSIFPSGYGTVENCDKIERFERMKRKAILRAECTITNSVSTEKVI